MKNSKKTSRAKKTSDVSASVKNTAVKKGSKNRLPLYIILGVLTFLLAVTVAIGALYASSTPSLDDENPFDNPSPVVNPNAAEDDKNSEKQVSADGRKQEMYNLMVVGKDYWSGSTDVIMIVSVNTAKNDISVLQIPRDSTVDCGVNENHGKRVNAIYAYALSALKSVAVNPQKEYDDIAMAKVAPMYLSSMKDNKTAENRKFNDELRGKMALEYLKETLKRTFCIAIDGYVMVDVAGFREIVDVLGGVEVDVPQNMHYDDDEQNLHIHLNKGVQLLDGKKAEGFVRYRYGYVDGDIGRVNAQKIFLSALAKKVMSFSTITKIQPLVETCFEYTTTNLTTTDIIGYAKILLGMDLSNIKFYTAPGEAYQTSSGAWYYSLYTDENIQIINDHFNDYDRIVTAEDITLRQVVKNYNISYNNQGISAEEIENSELNLTKSDVTYNPVPGSGDSSGVSTPVKREEDDNDSVEVSAEVKDDETDDNAESSPAIGENEDDGENEQNDADSQLENKSDEASGSDADDSSLIDVTVSEENSADEKYDEEPDDKTADSSDNTEEKNETSETVPDDDQKTEASEDTATKNDGSVESDDTEENQNEDKTSVTETPEASDISDENQETDGEDDVEKIPETDEQ